jgi:hypothetical protein
MEDLIKMIVPLHGITNNLLIALTLLTTYHQVPAVTIPLKLLEGAMRLLRSLMLSRNAHLPTTFNHLWVLQTAQHPPDQRPIHILVVSHSKNNKPSLPLQRRLIPPGYILTVLLLSPHRLKVLHKDCLHTLQSSRLCKHLHQQLLQALEAMLHQVLLRVQLLILVVPHLVHKEMAETTGTLWQP